MLTWRAWRRCEGLSLHTSALRGCFMLQETPARPRCPACAVLMRRKAGAGPPLLSPHRRQPRHACHWTPPAPRALLRKHPLQIFCLSAVQAWEQGLCKAVGVSNFNAEVREKIDAPACIHLATCCCWCAPSTCLLVRSAPGIHLFLQPLPMCSAATAWCLQFLDACHCLVCSACARRPSSWRAAAPASPLTRLVLVLGGLWCNCCRFTKISFGMVGQ